jgi:hypothetical protein
LGKRWEDILIFDNYFNQEGDTNHEKCKFKVKIFNYAPIFPRTYPSSWGKAKAICTWISKVFPIYPIVFQVKKKKWLHIASYHINDGIEKQNGEAGKIAPY